MGKSKAMLLAQPLDRVPEKLSQQRHKNGGAIECRRR